MSTDRDFTLDRQAVRRHARAHAAAALAGRDKPASDPHFLSREVAGRMAERLALIRNQPARILDIGCGTGADFALLAGRYPNASLTGIDLCQALLPRPARSGWLQRMLGSGAGPQSICADAEQLPVRRSSMQMVWSNLMLNWLHDPLPALREMHRVLEVDGMLMFSTLGPDTLRELREALPAGHGERVHRFIDMHDLGDALVKAGFAEPVMDMETLTLTYQDLDGLLRDLRQAGASNASTQRPRGLSGRQGWQAARDRYEQLRRDGRLPATFEIVYGHAWKAAPKTTDDGRAVIQFRKRDK
ncbi:methyltransferase domain-containing protein [Viridibacterium curvum]|uniref:Malonyl-[acyl-carrier protein] O-methyltransferase n=1 Tax=Viridibacterium curvum TaxID=1101404 RepID=A0ABP9Q7Q9_9RHOO